MLSFAVVFDSRRATVSLLAASSDVIRARRVSTSEVDVLEDDLRVWSSLSSDDLAFSNREHN